jgi:hypothetical protein
MIVEMIPPLLKIRKVFQDMKGNANTGFSSIDRYWFQLELSDMNKMKFMTIMTLK